ncbi:hypothetical protein ABKN59_011877 [Abortiporus biennis]
MTHLLPPHAELNLSHSTLQTALQMDPNQQQAQQQSPQSQQAQASGSSRKRKKTDASGDDAPHAAEPRRLRRSHEACARCRSKKIKCDSKHPRCTACATAGVPCHQEDRHRQTLVARDHRERLERQLAGCIALLKRRMPDFDINALDDILAREGVEPEGAEANPGMYQYPPTPTPRGFPLRSEGPQPGDGSSPRHYYPPGPPMVPPGYPPPPMAMHYSPYPPPPHMMAPPPGYNPHMPPPHHPAFQHTLPPPQQLQQTRPQSAHDTRATEPLPNDLSTIPALAKNFGVAANIVNGLKLIPNAEDKEDLAVGDSGLSSRRDKDQMIGPNDMSKWIPISVRRNSTSLSSPTSPKLPPENDSPAVMWLPKDTHMLHRILDVYFSRLNFHRPVFTRAAFEKRLSEIYEGRESPDDPGFTCSVYLLLALGTLSELNHLVQTKEQEGKDGSTTFTNPKQLMPPDWPSHEDFFKLALAVKPELRVSLSSLQALILLQWYLYTERQGRTLWRLIGSMVRLAIELGLHHDPTTPVQPSMHDPNQQVPPSPAFSDEECQLRIRLWSIVLLHDRGTSILLGRPLAIAPSDSNTPRPRPSPSEISEHFILSAPIAEIQADIINSLYAPITQNADSIMRHATRITKSMVEFRKQLPGSYKNFFSGTDDWTTEKRVKLVQDITEDQGLTLLKIGITRILLLRALFSSNAMPYHARYYALVDAIVTSHNIIVVHNHLIKFPNIAFFVSPIPLHIAAMVILFGHMSKCDKLPLEVAMEDVWMALDMLPSFRWRWERKGKDINGGHPLIAKLAEEVLKVNLHQVAPASAPMLMSEQDWDTEFVLSPKSNNGNIDQSRMQPNMTPPMGSAFPASYGQSNGSSPVMKGSNSPGKSLKNGHPGTPADKKLPDLPANLFYPFYPDNQNVATNTAAAVAAAAGAPILSGNPAMQQFGGYPDQPPFILEEKESPFQFMNGHDPKAPMHAFPMPPPS